MLLWLAMRISQLFTSAESFKVDSFAHAVMNVSCTTSSASELQPRMRVAWARTYGPYRRTITSNA